MSVVKSPFERPDSEYILPNLLELRGESHPGAVYLQEIDGPSYTYAEAYELMRRLAGGLRSLGVVDEHRVVSMLPNSADSYLIMGAVGLTGGIHTPLNTAYVGKILEHTINVVAPTVIILDAAYLDKLNDINLPQSATLVVRNSAKVESSGDASLEALFEYEAAPANLRPLRQWDDIGMLLFTSGTTGVSKAVKIPWLHFYKSAMGIWQAQELDSSVRMYSPWPINHVSGAGAAYMVALLAGTLVIREKWSTSAFVEDIVRHACNCTTLMGSTVNHVAQLPDVEKVTLTHVFVAPVNATTIDLMDRIGARFCTNYNSTETSSPIGSEGYEPVPLGSAGTLRSDVEYRIVDEEGRDVIPGTTGELLLRPFDPAAMNNGYWGVKRATEEAWEDGWYHTGDLLSVSRDGYFYLAGRAKDRIRVRGENVNPDEVESVLQEYNGLTSCAAVGIPEEHTGEDEICLFVVPTHAYDERELRSLAESQLPKFMRPMHYVQVDYLPMTDTGKVQRNVLRDRITRKNSYSPSK